MLAFDLAECANLDGIVPANSEKQPSVLDAATRYAAEALTNQSVDLIEKSDRVFDSKRRTWPVPFPGGTTHRH